ncbi:MAG TPA: hypothetical protein VEF06_04060 [Bryobacteraceae bacterium]|nr:hypothetical protein [Bryobacteraceae bacterium]
MPEDATADPTWREIISKHQAAMVDDLSMRLAADISDAVNSALAAERSQASRQIARACDEARRAHSESLNQALRRLRSAASQEKTLELLRESSAPYAERSAVLVFDEARAHAIGGGELAFELSEAPAILSAIETREPLVTVASAEQISPALASALAPDRDDDGARKAWLFPLISRGAAAAVVVVAGRVDPSPVELLCEAAAMRLESFLAPAAAPAKRVEELAWDDLSPEDQRLHLQAQRMARVRVAEIRLYEEDALRRGIAASNIYEPLQTKIDAARREFLQSFLSRSATMVDYLHLEILRSLAKDDAKLLGATYPGPMV